MSECPICALFGRYECPTHHRDVNWTDDSFDWNHLVNYFAFQDAMDRIAKHWRGT